VYLCRVERANIFIANNFRIQYVQKSKQTVTNKDECFTELWTLTVTTDSLRNLVVRRHCKHMCEKERREKKALGYRSCHCCPCVCPFICLSVCVRTEECNVHKTDLREISYLGFCSQICWQIPILSKIGHEQNTLEMKTCTSLYVAAYGLHKWDRPSFLCGASWRSEHKSWVQISPFTRHSLWSNINTLAR
jgi:hypothetical protein